MSKVIRSVKNVTKGYSATQVKVRNATSNDPWGPTGTEMAEIAAMTYDTSTDFFEIMDMLDKRLNDKGKNWRHVLKALKVLDYCLHEGSENVVVWAKDNIYIIKTLREFQYIDEENRDQGLNVRVSARELTALLQDDERLRAERKDRKSWKSRVHGIEDSHSSDGYPGRARQGPPRRPSHRGRDRTEEEEWEYRMAIEASKNQAEEDRKRQSRDTADEDLAKAIKLSQEEEERRQREQQEALAQQNADSLFDDAPAPQPQQQPQQQYFQQQPTFQMDYQQGQSVDMWGNPMQTQSTGYLNGLYAQPTAQGYPQQYQQTGFNPQQTGFNPQQTGFMAPASLPPQPTGYNPYQTSLSPQPTSLNNPYANGLAPPAQQLQPMTTGSNNPFAPKMASPRSPPKTAPSLNDLANQQKNNAFAGAFNQQSSQPFGGTTFANQTSLQPQQTAFRPSSPAQQQQQQKPLNPQHAALEAMLAAGSGQDTFGNTGELRIPAQHTAPGTFVNSAGHGLGRTPQGQQNQNNPFFTGQTTGFQGMPQLQYGVQGGMMPARTGPAQMGMQGNPFGGGQFGGQQQQQQGGNLIDL